MKRPRVNSGEAILRIRESLRLSQRELAEKAGLDQPTVSGLESGRYKLGNRRARALAKAMGVHPGVLLFPGWDIEKESGA